MKFKNLKWNKKKLSVFLIIGMFAVFGIGSVANFWSTFNVGEDWLIKADITQLSVGGWEFVGSEQDFVGSIVSVEGDDDVGVHMMEIEPDAELPIVPMSEAIVPRGDLGYPSVITEVVFDQNFSVEESSGGVSVTVYTYSISAVINIQTHTDIQSFDDGFILNTGAEELDVYEYAELAPMYGERIFSVEVTFSLEPKNDNVVSTCVFDSANVQSHVIGQKLVGDSLQDLDYFEFESGRISTYGALDCVIGTNGVNTKAITASGSFSNGGQVSEERLSIHEGFIQIPIEFEVRHEVDDFASARFQVPSWLAMLPSSFTVEELQNTWFYLVIALVIVVVIPGTIAVFLYREKK
jgi:hypothetical protein